MKTTLMLALASGLLAALPAAAQEAPPAGFDSRWHPYVGCWKIVQENLGAHPVPLAPGTEVCVKPSGRTGVSVTTTVNGKAALEQTIVADGTAQKISQADCTGTQTSEWSRDGDRLFTRAEITCTGRPTRNVSGITLLARGYWIDAQATLIDGNQDVRVRRYERTSGGYAPAMGTPFTVEDVIEASAKVQSEALEAALDEAGGTFTLDSRRLKQLAESGVAPNVIDLMVAQAFPSKFQVERRGYASAPSAGLSSGMTTSIYGGTSVYGGTAAYPYPFADAYYDPFFYPSYYYSPFAYSYYWGPSYSYRYGYPYRNYYYNNYYSGVPGGIWSSGGSSSGGSSAQPGSGATGGGEGVVVPGRGYTRVRPNSPSNTDSSSGGSATRTRSGGGAVRGVDSGSSSSSSSSSSGSSSSSSSSSSPSSSSSSSGSSGGGRTAQPR